MHRLMHTKHLYLETSQECEACTTGFRLQRTLQQHPLYLVSVQCLPDHRTTECSTSSSMAADRQSAAVRILCTSDVSKLSLGLQLEGGCEYYPTGMLKVTAVCGLTSMKMI